MATRIDRLRLNGFRGATQPLVLTFDPTCPLTVLYGENGSGKSTIVDAIDFVCNERFGALEDLSGATPRTHVVSLNGSPKNLLVELGSGAARWVGQLAGGKIQVTGAGERPRAFILRRRDIAQVVAATPKSKYEALKAYITAPHIEKCEQALREALRVAARSRDEAQAARNSASATLQQLWAGEGDPQGGSLTQAADRATADQEALSLRIIAASSLIKLWRGVLEAQTQHAAAQAKAVEAAARLQAIDADLHALETQHVGQSGALITLLQDARVLLAEQSSLDRCPLCGQPATLGVLQARIDGQLQTMAALAAQQGAREVDRELASRAATVAEEYARELLDRGGKFYREAEQWPALAPALQRLRMLPKAEHLTDRIARVTQLVAEVRTAMEIIEDQRDADQVRHSALTAFMTAQEAIDANSARLAESIALCDQLQAMLAVVERERKAYVDGILHDIAATVDAFYTRIHPEEGLGGVRLQLKPNVMGSLELDVRFGDAGAVAPVAYYSEGHLETLGLCVFLALSKQAGEAVLVLDDVLTTVDDAHLERIVDLLYDAVHSFPQIILTTHSSGLYTRFAAAQAAGRNVQVVSLQSWSMADGISLVNEH